ncbi:MAG: hypothetical protein APR63_01350 [Desulfuromonas sp. SDB]|nr:MAG: hypothetical protein APR63_01350 [Desulfuromonas sp. SDB]
MEVIRDNTVSERHLTGLFDWELMTQGAKLLKSELIAFTVRTNKLAVPLIFLKKKNKLICPPTFAYNAFIPVKINFSDKSNQRHWLAIVNKLKKHLPRHGSILCHPWYYDLRPFIWNNYKVDILYTFRNNMKWREQDVEREEKKQINKALKKNLMLVTHTPTQQLVDLLLQSYRRHGRKPPYSSEYIYGLMETARKNQTAQVISVVDEEQNLLAFRAKLLSDRQDYDWIAGSNIQGLKQGANAFALHESIKQSRDQGKIIDLCGANTKSVALFKAGFGMELISYARISW